MPGTSPTVFISYSRTNTDFVDRLEADLHTHQLRTWVDRRKLEGGQDWLDQIQSAIDQCQVLVLILSPEAVQSKYVRMEYRYAQNTGKLVIPVQHQPTDIIPMDLYTIQWIDLHTDYAVGLQHLVTTLQRISTPPSPVESNQPQDTASVSPSSTMKAGDEKSSLRSDNDIYQPVELSLADTYNGTKRTFVLQWPLSCTSCQGIGKIQGKACAACDGQGQRIRTKRIEVGIPAGVDNGSKVRAAGEGHRNPDDTTSRGDLFLVVSVRPDPNFRRVGDDLHMDVAISASTAQNGGEIPFTFPDGKRVLLTINPNTKNGQEYRFTGKGMANVRTGVRGNIYVRVLVAVG